jgi:hypothetical protein
MLQRTFVMLGSILLSLTLYLCFLQVINLYIELLKERAEREPKRFLKCHFFNTFFYRKVSSLPFCFPHTYIVSSKMSGLLIPFESYGIMLLE